MQKRMTMMDGQETYSSRLQYERYPHFWNHAGTADILRTMLQMTEWKFAKKEREAPDSKSFVNLNYMNIPASFDIEDTSFYNQDTKVSTMYVWQFGLNNVVFMGRTWDEFIQLIDVIREFTDRHNRIIIYVHFLDHEFAFMRKLFKWTMVFSRKTRSPIYAIAEGGVEFRDSYILTGKSLAKSAEDIRTYRGMKKQVGDLDYTLMRGTKTPLTKKEIGYCMKDVQILNTIIAEKIDDEGGNIGKIPLTNTGYVRRYVRSLCLPGGRKDRKQYEEYFKMIHSLNLTATEYTLLKAAFQGGFTHANALHVGDNIADRVDSIDFTSSYPAVMLSNFFPMSTGREVQPKTQEEIDTYLKKYLCVFMIRFKNIRQKSSVYENIIGASQCRLKNAVLNNGRVVKADELITATTSVDLESIKKFYDYDGFDVKNFYIYKKGYLPKPIIGAVLDLYRAKTTLKGIPEKAVEYLLKKGMLNSTYGMMVTDIVKALIICSEDGEWEGEEIPNIEEAIDKYNESKKRFNFYPWGVFITAYARRNLYSGILAFGKDYLYSDTDSIKCLNMDKHMDYVNNYNKYIVKAIDNVLTYYNIDSEEARPKNIKGKEKQIGVWDWETNDDPYTEFKTLGAKRYMYTQKDGLHITIAGVSKKMGKEYIQSQAEPFEFFRDGMIIDKDHSGKLTHTYLDYEQHGVMTDYMGNVMPYDEMSSVHLEKAEYKMSMSNEFSRYINSIKDLNQR